MNLMQFSNNFLLKEHFLNFLGKSNVFAGFNREQIPDYEFIKELDNSVTNSLIRRSLYENTNHGQVIVKTLQYAHKNMTYYHTKNDAITLKYINKLTNTVGNKNNVKFPKLISIRDRKNTLTITREYLQGKKLSSYSSPEMTRTLISCIEKLNNLSTKIMRDKLNVLPRRGPLYTFLCFVFYYLRFLSKNPKFVRNTFKLFVFFYSQFSLETFRSPKFVIAHRDLTQNNILLNKKNIYIIDFETTVVAEKETDLAISSLYFNKKLGNDLNKILIHFLRTHSQKRNFLRLTIFYTFLLLSNESKNTHTYKDAVGYLGTLNNKIIPALNLTVLSRQVK